MNNIYILLIVLGLILVSKKTIEHYYLGEYHKVKQCKCRPNI